MKEFKLTSNSALTETVYETNFNGNYLDVKLATGALEAAVQDEINPNIDIYHVVYPKADDTVLFEQPVDAADNKVPVYGLGIADETQGCCCKHKIEDGEIRRFTSRKVMAHGPIWVYAAIAIGMDKEGSESPIMVSQGIGSYGSDNTTESEMIGYVDGKIHDMCALIVRRARLEELPLASIRVGYKYLFIEPENVGLAKVKEG